jgi:vacuolar protein sorting-associated protein 53
MSAGATYSVKLEQKIKEKIKDEYKEQVSLQAEKDIFILYVYVLPLDLRLFNHPFSSVISSSINVLLVHLDAVIDPSFNIMARTSYPAHSQVSGPSSWMGELVASIESVVGAVKGDADASGVEGKKYVRNFLDKCCRQAAKHSFAKRQIKATVTAV